MHYDKQLILHKLTRWEHYLKNYRLPQWKELPDIGLYMDQVIALLAQYMDFIPLEGPRNRPLTPTTINNYVRLKVMPAPIKRKYYRIHIAYLVIIFTMKQGISINSIQRILPQEAEEEEIRAFYTSYIEKLHLMAEAFCEESRKNAEDVRLDNENAVEDIIMQIVLTSAFSRLFAEKLMSLQDADPETVLEKEREEAESGKRGLQHFPSPEE